MAKKNRHIFYNNRIVAWEKENMSLQKTEEQLIDELMAKYPVRVQGAPASPEHLYRDRLEQYAEFYVRQHPEADAEKATAEILHYADYAKENEISVLQPRRNLQPDGLYYDKGELILPGIVALKNHDMEEYARDFQTAYDTVRHTEPLISRDVAAVIDHAGAVCAGLECSVKTGPSLSGKLVRDNLLSSPDPVFAIGRLNDVVRYTAVAGSRDLTDAAKNIISQLSQSGYQLFRIKNFFAKPREDSGYQGLHLNFSSPYGVKIELQCHTEESFRIKSAVHRQYEFVRNPDVPESEKTPVLQYLQERFRRIPPVPGIEQVRPFGHSSTPAFLPAVHIQKEAGHCIEAFSVMQDGCRLLSGIEQVARSGDISVAYSFDQERCTRIYQQKNGRMTGRIENVSVDFTGRAAQEFIRSSAPDRDTQDFSR